MNSSYQEFKTLAKGSGPEVYFNALYLHISYPLSYLLVRLKFSPNTVTYLSILCALGGGMLMVGSFPVMGCLFFMLSYLLDFCDGSVARFLMRSGGVRTDFDRERGKLLENVNSNVGYFMLFFSVGYYLWNTTHDVRYLLIGFVAYGVKMILRYTNIQAAILYKPFSSQESGTPSPLEAFQGSWKNKIKFTFSKCVFAANFYFIVYLVIFLFFPAFAPMMFFYYSAADIAYSLLRLGKVALQTKP